MRFYERFNLKPIHVAVISALLITTNPLQIPQDPQASASEVSPIEIKIPKPKPVLVERTPEMAKVYAHTQLNEYGWDTPEQWACLLDLWTRESNWTPSSYNKIVVYQDGKKLHAGGIPQILGLDPDATVEYQVFRGYEYIEARYDTPCKAMFFWNKNFWY